MAEPLIDRRQTRLLERETAKLRERGFAMMSEEYGPAATGKSTRARAMEARLKAEGKDVVVLEDIWQRGGGCGVQVWARA